MCAKPGAAQTVTFVSGLDNASCGGWGGIRTPGELTPTPVFKTGALNHSTTHPTDRSYKSADAGLKRAPYTLSLDASQPALMLHHINTLVSMLGHDASAIPP